MQVYRVYHHPTQGYAAITSGFNWSAAVMNLFWTMSNSLWGPSFLLLIGWIACIAGIVTAGRMNLQMLALTFVALGVLLPLWSGMSAMGWQEKQLKKKGFNLVNKVRAKSGNGAIHTTRQKAGNKKQDSA